MKKLLFLFLCLISFSSAYAVEYYSVGGDANFNVYTFDGKYYLVLSFKDSDKNHLTNNSVVKFMLTNGKY